MKEKIFAMSLGVVVSIPTIFEALRIPIHAYTRNDILIDVEKGEHIQIIENIDKERILIPSGDTFSYSHSPAREPKKANVVEKEFIPFTQKSERLSQFKYQVSSEMPEGYHADFHFDSTNNYQFVKGISTFRGTNFRQNAFFGKATILEKTFEKVWTNTIGQTDSWTGIGWNGQPSIIQWDDDVKNQMNLYNEFKLKENFTEVICGGLDSTIHFYDLESGLPCRPSIKVPSSIKGSVTIDPRGYPLLYVGQGINEVGGVSVKFGYHIFSLITGEELYFINGRDKFAYLSWGAFDGNPVIDGETDTLILPGENGILYIAKLNTNYDRVNGTISIAPILTRYRYTQSGKAGGMENAMTVYKHYAFFANNNGVVQCVDLNTLTPIWVYQMEDDCDATIGLEEEGDNIFLYVGCEVDKRAKESPAFVKKLNARTGEVIWEYSVNCQYDSDVNGGVLSSPIVGKDAISNLVIYNFSKVTSLYNGKMVALDKTTGAIIWSKSLTHYSWSSPVAIYSESGEVYLIFGDSAGVLHLINAKTGETVTTLQTGGGNMEGSPAIFDNHIVIGTRGKKVFRIDVK